ncbi:MAG: FmdB family transcriptional regulator [Armatimonadota bacterium]|nr:FmdB family transcriptional regulator [Armatimonadota bacterium]
MPTYGYQCLACDNQFEVFQSIKDDPLKVCESCGGELRKRVYPVGIAFKGSGFYVNDYAAKSKSSGDEGGGSAAKADAKPEAKAEAKSDTKTETKTEPKVEAPKAETKTPAAV